MLSLRSLFYGSLTLVVALCPLAGSAGAAPIGTTGDIAIFREATGGDDVPTTDFAHDFDTPVRADGVYSLNGGGNTDIQLSAGHHLVLYSSRFDSSSGSNRTEVQSQLTLDGSALPVGWSQGYIRRQNGQDETLTAGGGIVYADAADPGILSLHSFRTDANSATIQRAGDTAGIQVLKLDDNADYLRLSLAGNQTGPNTTSTWVPVQYDTQDEVDAGSFAHTSGTEDITLAKAGHYLVLANTYGERPANGDRASMTQRLTLDGTEVDGTRTTVYLRGNSNGNDCFQGAASIGTVIETTAPNQVLNVEGVLGANSEQITYVGGKTAVTIVRLSDDADYIRLNDSGADNFNPNSTTALGWDTELEKDPSFTHNDSQVGVAADDDYLFLSALYDADDGAARGTFWQRWQENGTDIQPYGQTGTYSRNDQVQDVGNWSGILLDLETGEYVETVSEQLGNSGTLSADVNGLQGVRVSTMWLVVPELTWDGATHGSGKWGESKWITPPPNFPGATEKAVINTAHTVTVADADRAAHKLTITGGGAVAVDPGRRLDIATELNAAAGSVSLDNSTLAVGGGGAVGTLTAANNATLSAGGRMTVGSAALDNSTLAAGGGGSIATLTADGNTTLSAGGSMAVASYSDNNTPTALTLAGGGTFTLDSVSTVAGSSFAVNGSSLQGAAAAKPLGNAQTLALTGSTLILADVVGAPGTGTVASNPKAHYKFDEIGTTTIAHDETGNYDAPVSTIGGTPAWTTDPVRGQVLDFDRADQTWVDVPAMGDEVDAVSFAMWINPQAQPGSYDALMNNDGWAGGVIHFAINPSYKVEADCNGGGGKKTMTNAMVQDEWHHVVYTYQKNGTVEYYFDGEPDSSHGGIPDRTVVMGGTTEGRSIGQWGDDRWVEAMLDDVVIYTRALTPTEAALMYATHTAPDFSAVSLTIGAGTSTLESQCISDVTFADLTMKQDAALATTGTAGAAFTGGTTIEAGATAIGFNPQTPMNLGAIDGSAAPNVVITKTGAGTLVLDNAGTDLAATATINAQEGTVVGYHGSNPFDEAILKVSGGEILLSAKPAATSPVTYDNPVVTGGNGVITAGAGSAGHAGPMTVNLGSAGNGVTINSGNTLTMRSADNYVLNVAGTVTGGGLAVDQGTVNLAAATVEDLAVSGTGQVNLSTNINLTNLTVTNDSVHAGSHLVTVAESGVMTCGVYDKSTYTATSGSFQASGDITQTGADTIILGGTLTISTDGAATFLEAKIGNGLDGSLVTNHPTYSVMGSGSDIWNKNDNFYFAYQEFAAGEEIDVSARAPGFTGGSDAWRKAEMMIRDDITDTSAFGACMQSQNDNVGAQYRTAVDVNALGNYHGGDPEPTFIRIRRAAGSSTIEYYYRENEGDPWLLQTSTDITMTGTDYVGLAVTAHKIDQQTTVDFDYLAGFAFDPVPTTLNNLTGEGEIVGSIIVAGELAPGASIGVIDVTGDLTLDAAAVCDVEVDGALIDLVTVTGDLALAGVLSIDGLLTEEQYTIMTYGGALSGAFDDISDVTAQGMTVNYSLPGAVRIVPEPASLALIAFGALGLLLRRKRG